MTPFSRMEDVFNHRYRDRLIKDWAIHLSPPICLFSFFLQKYDDVDFNQFLRCILFWNRKIEKYRRPEDCDSRDRKCIRKAKRRVEGERSNVRLYSSPQFWDCLTSHVDEVQREVARRHGTDSRVHIFVATDNEEMRPQFVSRLLKFGTVWYSTGNVIHISKQSRSSQKLPTAAEFYLLSKADHILQANTVVSTFSEFAAQLGNGTMLLPKQYTPNCRFKYIHRGVPLR